MNDGNDTAAVRARAAKYLAGGVLHHLSAIPDYPTPVFVRGAGSRMWDSDGREFIDYYLGSASLVLGHAHPEVCEAVRKQLELGAHFYELSPAAVDLAELVVEAVPCAEKLKYAMSGTEAVTAAVRLARAHTGRTKILKFEGAYHGSHDWMLWGYRHRQRINYPVAEPDSPGIPRELQQHVLVAPYNDAEALETIVHEHADDLAAVIAEPFLGNIRPQPGFLEAVRKVTRAHDIPVIFDEVVTGFRLALGGAQEYYNVIPDLTALGKSLGGGHPIGALVGRADMMEAFSPERVRQRKAVLHVGTFSGNPISCVAGAATIRVLKRPGSFERMHKLGAMLADGLRDVARKYKQDVFVINEGPTVDIWFTSKPVNRYPDTWDTDQDRLRRFKMALMERGVWSPPGLKMFISLVHTDQDIAFTIDAADAAMARL